MGGLGDLLEEEKGQALASHGWSPWVPLSYSGLALVIDMLLKNTSEIHFLDIMNRDEVANIKLI